MVFPVFLIKLNEEKHIFNEEANSNSRKQNSNSMKAGGPWVKDDFVFANPEGPYTLPMERLMDKILHDPKDPKLWELWYIPYNGQCRILSINRIRPPKNHPYFGFGDLLPSW